MRKLLLSSLVVSAAVTATLVTAGCGSSTTSSGTPPPSASFCGSFQIPANGGLICDNTTSPPTLKVNFGNTAGTVAAGDDPRIAAIDPDKGKFLGQFTPTVAQDGTHANPGGLFGTHGGGIVYNTATGKIGVIAADEICQSLKWPNDAGATVATAHMCTDDELMWNTHKGNIPIGTAGWTIGTAAYNGYNPPGQSDIQFSNFKSHCGNMTYDSKDQYSGTHFSVVNNDPKNVTVGAGKAVAIKFILDTDPQTSPSCANVLPISCCR